MSKLLTMVRKSFIMVHTVQRVVPEDGRVQRAEAHQVLECRLMEGAGHCRSQTQSVFIQEERDEEGQQDGYQLRT